MTKKQTTWSSEYFYGNKVSDYGIENGYVDYATLAKSFNCVLANSITELFFAEINGEYSEPEQINGFIDNSEEIEKLQDKIIEYTEEVDKIISIDDEFEDNAIYIAMEENIIELMEKIDNLKYKENCQPDIFQYYIISENGAKILEEWTDEIVYYLPVLDLYVWGVTHYGTSWDYVLTDIKIEKE